MAMPTKKVKIGEDVYEFYLTGGLKAFNASKKFASELGMILPSLMVKDANGVNLRIAKLIEENFEELFSTFIDKNNLKCNNEIILDFDEHFAGKFTDIPELLYKVIIENDKDFFHSLPTLAEKAMKWINEKQLVNSLKNPEETMDALAQMAQEKAENLGLSQ